MRQTIKKIAALLLLFTLFALTACGSSEPCESCRKTPTKGYKNEYSGEKEYYCSVCSSDCAFCRDEASEHYTSGLGIIIFACDDCYEEIQTLNS